MPIILSFVQDGTIAFTPTGKFKTVIGGEGLICLTRKASLLQDVIIFIISLINEEDIL